MKNKNHIITLRHAKKAFDKILHTFMIKILNKLGIEVLYLNTINTKQGKPTVSVKLNSRKMKAFPLKSGTR
jgi:hypothetical protein